MYRIHPVYRYWRFLKRNLANSFHKGGNVYCCNCYHHKCQVIYLVLKPFIEKKNQFPPIRKFCPQVNPKDRETQEVINISNSRATDSQWGRNFGPVPNQMIKYDILVIM